MYSNGQRHSCRGTQRVSKHTRHKVNREARKEGWAKNTWQSSNAPLLPSSPWDVLRPQALRLLCVCHFWTAQHDCLNLDPCKSISGKPRKLK